MLKKLGLSVVVLLALCFVIAMTFEGIAKSTLEKLATKAIGSEVTISSLDISPFSGSASLSGLKIMNPEGFSDDAVLSIPYIHTALNLKSVFSDEVRIEDIRVEGLNVLMEAGEKGSNLSVLQMRLKQQSRTQATAPETTEQGESAATKNVVIGVFKLVDATVRANIAGQEIADVKISDITLQDIGSKKGVTTVEAIQIVLDAIVRDAIKASTRLSLKGGVNKILDGAGDIGEGIGKGVKSLFE